MADQTPDPLDLADEDLDISPAEAAALQAQLEELMATIAADRRRFGERVLALLEHQLSEAPDDESRAQIQAEIDQKRADLAS